MQPQLVAIASRPGQYLLTEEHLLRLPHGRKYRLACLAGQAWITVEGVADDVWLEPGQSYRLPRYGLVLVGALNQCRILLEPPDSFWKRLARRFPSFRRIAAPSSASPELPS